MAPARSGRWAKRSDDVENEPRGQVRHGLLGVAWQNVRLGLIFIALNLSLGLFLGGCKKPQPAPFEIRVTRILVTDQESPEEKSRFSTAELHAAAVRGLARAGVQIAENTPQHAGDFQLRMQLRFEEEKGKHSVRALCAGLLSAVHGDEQTARTPEMRKLEHVGATEKSFAIEPDDAAVASLIMRLVEDSAHTLGQEVQLLGTESRALIALVGKPESDPELRKTAMQILGQRKEKLAVPVLIAFLKAPEPLDDGGRKDPAQRQNHALRNLLRDTAIGALVEIGDKSAVRPLLDSVAFRDHKEMGKVVAAAAALGGEDARRYLQFVAKSHPDAAVRADAETALQRLEQRHFQPSAQAKDKPSEEE